MWIGKEVVGTFSSTYIVDNWIPAMYQKVSSTNSLNPFTIFLRIVVIFKCLRMQGNSVL